jgi:Uma2 family endonuclease
MASIPVPYLSEEEYLAIERNAETKSEYHDGQMYAMAGGTRGHSRIAVNLCSEFSLALRDRDCSVENSDLRLRIPGRRSYVYPDLMISCDQAAPSPEFEDDIAEMPILVGEVLSPRTESYDRGAKFSMYRTIGTLREYLLASQSEPLVELFSRQPDGHWDISEARGLDAVLQVKSLNCSIALSAIYRRVRFPAKE